MSEQPASRHGRLIVRTWEEHALWSVMLELTYRCNLDCVFCYNDLGAAGTPLALPQYLALLEDLARMQVLHLVLTGGEPLAHPDFFAIGGRARELGFVVRVKSNGHALRGRLLRRLRDEVDPFVVEVSLHGATAETHDRQTRVPGSFLRLLSNVEEMQRLGLRLQLNATLTRWNEDETDGMLVIADRLGLPLRFDPVVAPRDDGDRAPLALTASAAGKERLYALLAARGPAPVDDCEPQRPELAPASAPARRFNCGAGTGSVTVDPFGNVLPCVQWRRPVGNLHQRPIDEIWRRSTELERVRRVNAEAATLAAATGTPWCMGLSELTTGDALLPPPDAERLVAELPGLDATTAAARPHGRRALRVVR